MTAAHWLLIGVGAGCFTLGFFFGTIRAQRFHQKQQALDTAVDRSLHYRPRL